MSDPKTMTVLYVKNTGNVLAAVTQVAKATGVISAASLAGEGVPVRGLWNFRRTGTSPQVFPDTYLIPPDALDVAEVPLDPEVLFLPRTVVYDPAQGLDADADHGRFDRCSPDNVHGNTIDRQADGKRPQRCARLDSGQWRLPQPPLERIRHDPEERYGSLTRPRHVPAGELFHIDPRGGVSALFDPPDPSVGVDRRRAVDSTRIGQGFSMISERHPATARRSSPSG